MLRSTLKRLLNAKIPKGEKPFGTPCHKTLLLFHYSICRTFCNKKEIPIWYGISDFRKEAQSLGFTSDAYYN